MITVGVTTMITPYVRLNGYYATFAVNGLASGAIDTMSSVWIVEMWEELCGPFVQGLQISLGLSAIISPLVANPFLSDTVTEFIGINQRSNHSSLEFMNNMTIATENVIQNKTLVNSTTIAIIELTQTRIQIPYLFVGGLNLVCATIMGGLYYYRPYIRRVIQSAVDERPLDNRRNKMAKMFARINKMFTTELWPSRAVLLLLLLAANTIGLVMAIMLNYNGYWLKFAQSSQIRLTNQMANNISILMWSAFSLSRAICVVLSYYVSPIPVTYACFTVLLVSQILFLIFQGTSIAIIWTGSALIGFGLGPIFANIYQLIESITPVTNLVGALFIFTIGLYMTITSLILGAYVEQFPMIFIYIMLFCCVVPLVLLIVIDLLIKKVIRVNFVNATQ
ncbi:major facilitator superfamily domain-containing protein 4A-like [Oppia nitens]|uniref:major facilitator superfamily domain-containing protein 4A-like n=1 Tax=Oppia nitens TaxID=1686743 RepID=UPI0023DC816D|nr:major facilitator superfamily domain-containing protein 4A-like [Oppia nitens]